MPWSLTQNGRQFKCDLLKPIQSAPPVINVKSICSWLFPTNFKDQFLRPVVKKRYFIQQFCGQFAIQMTIYERLLYVIKYGDNKMALAKAP